MLLGRRVAMIGVAAETARGYKQCVETSGGQCDCLTGEEPASFADYDAVVLAVGDKAAPPTLQATVMESCRSPVLAIGTHEALLPLIARLHGPQRDFAIDPCSESELGLRLGALLSSRQPSTAPMVHTVVVADDDRVTLGMVRAALAPHGFDCHTATDGDEALQLVKQLRPSAVILDVHMPRRNGFGVLREIRKDAATAATRVLMLTASAEQDYVRRASALRVDGYVVKPFQTAALLERLKTLLA